MERDKAKRECILMYELPDPRIGYLDELGIELRANSIKCELLTISGIPRLRLDIPWACYSADDEFQDNVIASSEPDGIYRFWWPWVQVIAPVNAIAEAVDHICRSAVKSCGDEDELTSAGETGY
jgi:hypothetical protein